MFLKLLILTILIHIIDDFGIQTASGLNLLKQKQWWINECYALKKMNRIDVTKYRYDYIIAVFIHALKWSIMISLPAMYFDANIWLIAGLVLVNTFIHGMIDHYKCNMYKITLIQDQLIHLGQIIISVTAFYFTI